MEIKNIWFEFEEWSGGYNEEDENSDVYFELSDGTKWHAMFYTYQNIVSISKKNLNTGECLSGKYFYADKPIFVSKMDKELIISVINDILHNESELSDVFTMISY